MKPLDLNLAARPFTNDTPLVVGLVLLAVVSLGLTAYDVHAWLTADSRKAALEAALADHEIRMREMKDEATRLQKELDSLDVEVLSAQADFVAGVLRERNFSWTGLFNDLEDVLPWNVRLVSIRPGFEAGLIKVSLEGVARHKKALFDFEEHLERSPRFSRVTPTSFRRAESSEQVLFGLEVRYSPVSPGPGHGEEGATGERAAARETGEEAEEPAEVIEVEGEPASVEEEPRPAKGAPIRREAAGSGAPAGTASGGAGGGSRAGSGSATGAAAPGKATTSGSRRSRRVGERGRGGEASAGVAGFVRGPGAGRSGGGRVDGAAAAANRSGSRGQARDGNAGRKAAPSRGGAPGAPPPRARDPEQVDEDDVVVWEGRTPKLKLKPAPGAEGMQVEPPAEDETGDSGTADEGDTGGDSGAGDTGGGSAGAGGGGGEAS